MDLVPLVTLRAEAGPPVHTQNGTGGGRYIADCVGGSFHGPRLTGTVLRSGGDWLLLDPRANETVSAALAEGREPAYGDMYYVVQPRFETGDERYAWVNGIVSIARVAWCPAERSTPCSKRADEPSGPGGHHTPSCPHRPLGADVDGRGPAGCR